MDFVLIGGLWLPPRDWDDTVRELESQGHRGYIVELPGQGDGNTAATLDDQLQAVLRVVDSAERPIVVGHSAACTLAWLVADRRPDEIRSVALVGGFPSTDGEQYAPFFPIVDGVMPFPGWEPFEGPDSDDLTSLQKQQFAAAAIPVPEGVAHGVVGYTSEFRRDVPMALICPEYSPDEARGWVAGGDLPEVAAATKVTYVNLDSGHWPMLSKPVELATVLAALDR